MADLTIPITGGGVLVVVLGLVGFFGKEKIAEMRERRLAFEAHIIFCQKKEKDAILLEHRVLAMEAQFKGSRATMHWLGDCLMQVGAKLNVNLPTRPEL